MTIQCPRCKEKVKLPEDPEQKSVACPVCTLQIEIPQASHEHQVEAMSPESAIETIEKESAPLKPQKIEPAFKPAAARPRAAATKTPRPTCLQCGGEMHAHVLKNSGENALGCLVILIGVMATGAFPLLAMTLGMQIAMTFFQSFILTHGNGFVTFTIVFGLIAGLAAAACSIVYGGKALVSRQSFWVCRSCGSRVAKL